MIKSRPLGLSKFIIFGFILTFYCSCKNNNKDNITSKSQIKTEVTAKEILGNPDYLAISYGGYRERSRDIQPTIQELKDDMKLLDAMGVRFLRTYNVHLAQASNLLEAISQLKKEDSTFEMYVMLGAWIDCLHAFNPSQGEPDHSKESERNKVEIETAATLAKKYPDIVKIIAVGNEAMVNWATSYYVQPAVILKWVNYLQDLKKSGELSADLWITSSDDFASWGGGDPSYHTTELVQLFEAVDYISMHTYPYHNTHYNPEFWGVPDSESGLSDVKKIDNAMLRALEFSKSQYDSVANYMKSVGVDKPIHIGETGWASISDGHYGSKGSRATDEYKQGLFYKLMREWTNSAGISCFYFEAFNEKWKDAQNPLGSENHFGLFTIDGKAKYPIWDLVDDGIFNGLKRDDNPITKTYGGDKKALLKDVLVPATESEIMSIN